MDDDRLLTSHEAARWLGFQEVTLRVWRQKRTGPEYLRVGEKAIRYRRSALEMWAERGRQEADET